MNDALTIRLEIGAAWEIVVSYWWIGVIQKKLGHLDAAAESIETAITLATQLNHPNLPDLQALLAEINVQRGK